MTLVVPIIATYYFLSVLLTTNPITWLLDFIFIDANRVRNMSHKQASEMNIFLEGVGGINLIYSWQKFLSRGGGYTKDSLP